MDTYNLVSNAELSLWMFEGKGLGAFLLAFVATVFLLVNASAAQTLASGIVRALAKISMSKK